MNSFELQKLKNEFGALYGKELLIDKFNDYMLCISSYQKDAVDAFVEEFGINLLNLSNFEDAFLGEYASKQEFLEDLIAKSAWDLPDFIAIDWDLSFDNREEIFCHGFVFAASF